VQFWFALLVSHPKGRLRAGENGPLLPLVSESRAAGEALGRLTAGRSAHHASVRVSHLLVRSSKTFGRGPALERKWSAKVEIAVVGTTVAGNAVHPSFTKVPLTSAGEKGNIVGLQAEW
jgi:hypothetical protein